MFALQIRVADCAPQVYKHCSAGAVPRGLATVELAPTTRGSQENCMRSTCGSDACWTGLSRKDSVLCRSTCKDSKQRTTCPVALKDKTLTAPLAATNTPASQDQTHVAPLMWDPSETTHLSRRKMWPDRRDGLRRLSLIVMNETVVKCALHGASFYLMSPKEDFQASLCSTRYMARLQDSQPRLQLESSLETIPKFAV